MGSFLVSCCASNQTIREGGDVYIMPIFENGDIEKGSNGERLQGLSRIIYNTDLYGLLGFIFTGYYNDYGRYVINWDKASNKYMLKNYLEYLQENAVDVEQGENTYHDVPFKPNDLVLTDNYDEVWDYIHEAIWEGRLFLKRSFYKGGYIYAKVEYFVGHKTSIDILINMYSKRPVEDAYFYSEEAKNFYKKSIKNKSLVLFNEFKQLSKDISRTSSWARKDYYHFLGESLNSSENVAWQPHYSIRQNLVQDHLEDFDSYLDIYTAFSTMKDMITSFTYCNVIIRPVYYAGQDYGNDNGNRFLYWMSLVQKQNIKDMMENDHFYLEDDDEEEIPLSTFAIKKYIEKTSKNFR